MKDGADNTSFAAAIIKKLFTALIITILLLFASNIAWLMVFTQYETYIYEVSQDVEAGPANFIGGDGDIRNGVSEGQSDSSQEEERQSER